MKNYKNTLCLILVLTMLLALAAGCGQKKDGSADVTSNNPTESPANSNPADDTAFSYSADIDENGYLKGIKALDYVENLTYKALPIPSDAHVISEETLQAEIDKMLAEYSSTEQVKDRAVVDGDTVNIDYVGSVDGVEFDGGSTSGAGTDVTIGVTSYIDDFLEQLIGHMPGETFNVEVTFPDVYQDTSLQGKDAVFVTTINYIVKTVESELTDEFVKTNFSDSLGWESVAGLKEGMSAELQKTSMQQYINNYLTNEVTVKSIPDSLTQFQEKAMLQYYQEGAEYYGMAFEEFLSAYAGVSSTDELIENNRDNNAQNSRYTLVAQAIAEELKISVSEEDMIKHYTDYSQYEEQYGLPYLKQIVLFQKVVDYIADNAVLE